MRLSDDREFFINTLVDQDLPLPITTERAIRMRHVDTKYNVTRNGSFRLLVFRDLKGSDYGVLLKAAKSSYDDPSVINDISNYDQQDMENYIQTLGVSEGIANTIKLHFEGRHSKEFEQRECSR